MAERPAPLRWAPLLALCLLWLLPGLLGHEPWKPDEAYTFGLVRHIAASGDWVVPTLAGEPFMEKPPLFFISAAWTMRLFEGWLGAPDAARLAAGLWNLIAWLGLATAARALFGPGHGRWALVLLIGTLGLPLRAHQLITDTALLAGCCWGLAGLSQALTYPARAGLMLGAGAAIAFLSKGLLGPGCLAAAALALLARRDYRRPAYLKTLAVALATALPLPLLWMASLYQRDPALFHLWLDANNFGRFRGTVNLGPRAGRGFYGLTLPWYALPVWPLALLALWRAARGRIAWPPLLPPLALFACTLAVLAAAADARELYALPLLPPLALLAAAGLQGARSRPLRWPGHALTLLLLALLAYLLLVAYALSFPLGADWGRELLGRKFSGWTPQFQPGRWLLFAASAALLAWCWLQPLAGGYRLAWRWSVGLTLLWCGMAILWLPALDHGMRYREAFAALRPGPDTLIRPGDCVASLGLGEPQRALLEYYAGLRTRRLEVSSGAGSCRWLLLQTLHDQVPAPYNTLHPIYTFQRPGDHKERFRLYSLR
ncbi:glycosyltransferase family 39 protein [Chromobacterium violaceum]|uniref:ArnT family glycosyltransferase n=1 Tax=Chromobacterium violaceum TaxID=536 RepID=UPI001E5A8008|nr:glycosyltransferase family 39 protein [Chromobacterium violaceum]MCD0494735.1 glycosyltransferase family 39 protein [Chromobacterium violaceum]